MGTQAAEEEKTPAKVNKPRVTKSHSQSRNLHTKHHTKTKKGEDYNEQIQSDLVLLFRLLGFAGFLLFVHKVPPQLWLVRCFLQMGDLFHDELDSHPMSSNGAHVSNALWGAPLTIVLKESTIEFKLIKHDIPQVPPFLFFLIRTNLFGA